MVKAHPIEIGSRVIAIVEEGHSHREAARHIRVSPRFVNDMVILKRENGGLEVKARGGRRRSKLAPCEDWMQARLMEKGDPTLDGNVVELASVHGVTVHRGSVGRWLHRTGLASAINRLCSPANSCVPTWPSGARPGLKSASLPLLTCWQACLYR